MRSNLVLAGYVSVDTTQKTDKKQVNVFNHS